MLSDVEILQRLKFGALKIEPFDRKRLGPVSYDITTEAIRCDEGVYDLVSKEKFTLPRDLAGIIGLRSRSSVLGLFASFSPLVDPGFSGKLIFLVFNPNRSKIGFRSLTNILQVMFLKVNKVDVAYNERKSSSAMGRERF